MLDVLNWLADTLRDLFNTLVNNPYFAFIVFLSCFVGVVQLVRSLFAKSS